MTSSTTRKNVLQKRTPSQVQCGLYTFLQYPYNLLPSSKLTWQWKIPIFNREYIFNWSIFHCHVSLPVDTVLVHYSHVNFATCIDWVPSPLALHLPKFLRLRRVDLCHDPSDHLCSYRFCLATASWEISEKNVGTCDVFKWWLV